jgi:hypothetical protein
MRRALLAVVAITILTRDATAVRAADVAAWHLLASTPALPPTLGVPFAVYSPMQGRVLVIDQDPSLLRAPGVRVFDTVPQPHWSTLIDDTRLGSLVYDPVRDRLLAFGAQVWALPLSGPLAWQQLDTNGVSPPVRGGQSTIYDPVNDRVIMFGGAGGAYLADVWSFSLTSNTWSELLPAGAAPGGREGHGAIYDPALQRMLVFGGHYEAASRGFWSDLWQLSLNDTPTWTELHPAGTIPGARSALGTVYDPVRRRMLIHGGINAQSGVEPDDLWALSLDGAPAWTPILTANHLRGHSYPADVYDPVADRLLDCGAGGYPLTSELSLADPTQWRSVLPPDPEPSPGLHHGHEVVYDSRRDRFTELGGKYSTVDSSMWGFAPRDPHQWTPLSSLPTPDFDYFYSIHTQRAAYDSLEDRLLAYDGSQIWSMPAEGENGWTPLGPPRPFEDLNFEDPGFDAGVSVDSHNHRLILTGGFIPAGHVQVGSTEGVWALPLESAAQWTKLGILPQPHGSALHASFYDPIRNRLVLVGGTWNGGNIPIPLRDYGATVWTTPVDSSLEWTDLSSTTGTLPPGPPASHAAFDPQRNRLYLFADSTVWTRDVGDTGAWTELDFTSPRPVVGESVAYDPFRDQVVALFAQTPGSDDVQVWALTVGPPSASLVGSSSSANAIALTWESPAAIGRASSLQRRDGSSAWADLGPLDFDARGLATFADHDVSSGHRYDYRVQISIAGSPWFSNSVAVAADGAGRLTLSGPNPAIGVFRVDFNLPQAGPARLEAFDVTGRRCTSREVGGLGPGAHSILLDASGSLRPGIYVVRLQYAGETRTGRVVFMR